MTCSEVSVELINYTSEVPNTVAVTADGKDLLRPTPPAPTPTGSVPGRADPVGDASTGTPEPSATPSEQPSESAPAVPAPSPSSADLAETGSPSSTPVIGGAADAVLLVGGGTMLAVRKRRTAQN